MLDIILTVLFIWLALKVVGLAFKLTWSVAKIVASILFSIAIPMLIACLMFAGGALIAIPFGLMGLAFGLLKKCV